MTSKNYLRVHETEPATASEIRVALGITDKNTEDSLKLAEEKLTPILKDLGLPGLGKTILNGERIEM